MTDLLTSALKSALAFAASRSAISSAQERAILARWGRAEPGTECPHSPTGFHIVDTSMESGPNNCFHCEAPMMRAKETSDV